MARDVTVRGASYPSDLTDDQWELLEPVLNAPGKHGRKHADDLRTVVDAMLSVMCMPCETWPARGQVTVKLLIDSSRNSPKGRVWSEAR